MYKHISANEREYIAVQKVRGISNRRIARCLGRDLSTVKREIRRNRSGLTGGYSAIRAQHKAEERGALARRRHPLKNRGVYSYVLERLRWGWSPEQIAGRLRRVEYPGDSDWSICHETIYRFIYDDRNHNKQLFEFLPRKQKRRRKQTGRSVHKLRIPQRISIHDRPEAIDGRIEFGHWEGDSVEGRRSDKDGIHTEAERLTDFYAAIKVDAITGPEALKAQRQIFDGLPAIARKSVTLDNGRENHLHFRLRDELGIQTYFCDPYSSWQRGCNEHHNGLLRRYLPKGTSFRDLTQEELDDMVWEINNRPRKRLGYNTPQEMFTRELEESAGGHF